MKRRVGIAVWVVATGCYTSTLSTGGEDTYKYFPLDGDRTWTYQSTDTSLPYRLIAHKPVDSVADEATSTRVFTITFTPDCQSALEPCLVDADGDLIPDFEGEPLMTWQVSSDSVAGMLFHGFDDTAYAPPVTLASADQSADEVVTSESGGVSFSSSLLATEPCDVPYWRSDQPDGCKTFQLDDGGAGSPIAGEYIAIVQFGIVSFSQGGSESAWELQAYEDEL
ncbi:MAG TPA: hypothetical protein PKA64_07520 [Myxococcota bacterium]|nr:hypothetical protein [Myxococcota bacterium]